MKKMLLTLVIIILCLSNAIAQPTTVGLIGYWPMDGNFNDLGPYAIHGTNTAATATTNMTNQANKAMAFVNPGSSQPVYQWGTLPINSNLNFSGTQDFTISLWAYCNSTYYHAGGLYDNCLNRGGPGVWWWVTSFPAIQFNYKNASVGTPNGALTLNVWQQITCVRSAGQISIYINGIQVVSGAEGTQTPAFPIGPRIGSMSYDVYSPPQYNGHNGKIDDLRIYNRALSQAEITILAVLPIKLNFFTAAKKNNDITLKWQTALEQNSQSFIIQRSTDGTSFTDIGSVAAAGTSNTALNYSFNDILPASLIHLKTVYYRLKSVDIDGKFAISHIVPVKPAAAEMQLLVFPNPVKEMLNVQTGNMQRDDAVLLVTDATGRQVFKKEIQLSDGSNTVPVNISSLKPGIYIVRLIKGTESYIRKFVKE